MCKFFYDFVFKTLFFVSRIFKLFSVDPFLELSSTLDVV